MGLKIETEQLQNSCNLEELKRQIQEKEKLQNFSEEYMNTNRACEEYQRQVGEKTEHLNRLQLEHLNARSEVEELRQQVIEKHNALQQASQLPDNSGNMDDLRKQLADREEQLKHLDWENIHIKAEKEGQHMQMMAKDEMIKKLSLDQ